MKTGKLGWGLLSLAAFLLFHTGSSREAGAVPAPKEKFTFIDLSSKANHERSDAFHSGTQDGNTLADLPKGEQKLGGVKFSIGASVLQLASTQVMDKPEKIEGIKVGRTLTRLHILHATGFQVEDGTVIGSYTVHYDDKTKAKIEIVYGKDVRDWWDGTDKNKVTRGKLAWEGTNAAVKRSNCKIRLYLTTWKNPHPKKMVVSIDYASTKTKAAPFCVAMTGESK
jgi:hypothetical protein